MKAIIAAILAMSVSTCVMAIEAPVSSPARETSGNQERLIEQLLTVSGLKKSLQALPAQSAASFMEVALRSGASTDEQKELVATLEQAFPKDVFVNRVRVAMRTNYDEERYARFLNRLSTPLAMRMAELEAQEPSSEDVQAFFERVSKRPLPPERVMLVQRLDAASGGSALLTTMTTASLEAGAFAAGDDCSVVIAKIRKMIEKNRPEIEKASRSRAQVMLAFTYRNVPDADLRTYVDLYEDKDSKWMQEMVQAAVGAQFKSSMEKGAQGIRKIIQAHKPKKTMFAPKCGQSESPSEDERRRDESVVGHKVEEQPESKVLSRRAAIPDHEIAFTDRQTAEEPQSSKKPEVKVAVPNKGGVILRKPAKRRHHSPGRDLRYCLDLATTAEIIACANK